MKISLGKGMFGPNKDQASKNLFARPHKEFQGVRRLCC